LVAGFHRSPKAGIASRAKGLSRPRLAAGAAAIDQDIADTRLPQLVALLGGLVERGDRPRVADGAVRPAMVRERGTERTSTSRSIGTCRSNTTRFATVRLECPIV
jgi:hypothetical protein